MLDFKFSTSVANRMKNFGADPSLIFGGMDPFDVASAIVDYKPIARYYKPQVMPALEQVEILEELLSEPLYGNPLITISSFPTDLRAKQTALHVFRNAIEQSTNTAKKPYWITLYGDRIDYAKIKARRPSMLFFSNVVMDSTPFKVEHLRDLCEMFPDIPRIIVTGGDPDATELSVKRLRLALNGAISIGPKQVVTNILAMMESME